MGRVRKGVEGYVRAPWRMGETAGEVMGGQLGCMESIWGDLLGAIPIEQSNKRSVYIYFIFSYPSKR